MSHFTVLPGSADSLLDLAAVAFDRHIGAGPKTWRVLIVDDDEDVHVATALALRDVTVEGRLLSSLHAASAREAKELIAADPDIAFGPLPVVGIDAILLRRVFTYPLSIALKFSRETPVPQIELAAEQHADEWDVTAQNNGVGFDPNLAGALFKPFSRLHAPRAPHFNSRCR